MSNRSLAAARNRRSPQEVVSDPSMKKNQHMPPQKMPPSPSSSSNNDSVGQKNGNKLSISDAIGLITIRLSKLESHTLKEQNEPHHTNATSTAGGVADVDTVLRSLVSRVSGLEKSTEGIQEHLEDLNTAVKELEETPERAVESTPSQPDPALLERLEKTEKEISELKQLVIRLQTMLIETTLAAKSVPTLPPSPPETTENGSMTLSI